MNTSSLKNLSKLERPRERILHYGAARLSDDELIAILLSSGLRGKNALVLARDLMRKFGREFDKATVVDFADFNGIGLGKAARLVAAMELGRRFADRETLRLFDSKDVWEEMREYRIRRKEYFVGFYIDVAGKVLGREVISVGSIDMTIVHPREVFEPAVRLNASQVIVAHNHPSGTLKPSKDDLLITKRLVEAAAIMGINLLDHVIVTKEGFMSFVQEGLLNR